MENMWILKNGNGQTFQLTQGKTHVVSRKEEGDLVLAKDQSVSRKHAYLKATQNGVEVWDECSKYGTFVRDGIAKGIKLKPAAKAILKPGDQVRFGISHNIWTLRERLFVCSSTLKSPEKIRLISLLSEMEGSLTDKWTGECTHLTMNSITLTVKVVCALASGKPIVLPSYWQSYHQMLKGSGTYPNPSDFLPPITENTLNRPKTTFSPNKGRKSLFKNKVFVFPTPKYFERYRIMVDFAGGQSVELSSCSQSVKELTGPEKIVIQDGGSEVEHSTKYKEIIKLLRDSNRRAVPEMEIGLSILDTSLERFCNPYRNSRELLRGRSNLDSEIESAMILATNTEDINIPGPSKREIAKQQDVVIPPTCPSASNSKSNTCENSMSKPASTSRKRASDSSSKENSSPKRPFSESDESTLVIKVNTGRNETFTSAETEDFSLPPMRAKRGRDSLEESGFSFTNGSEKSPKKQCPSDKDRDEFCLPSPPKLNTRNKSSISPNDENATDMFELPSIPASSGRKKATTDDDDVFGFDECVKPVPVGQSVNVADNGDLSASFDMFAQENEGVSEKPQASGRLDGKRKVRSDDDSSSHVPKKPALSHSTTLPKHQKTSLGFLNKSSAPTVKVEVKEEEDETNELGELLACKAAISIIPLIVRRPQGTKHINNNAAAAPENNTKNFKKFKKVLPCQQERHIVSTKKLYRDTTDGDLWVSMRNEREEEDEDDVEGVNGPAVKDEKDEWAFTFSQV